MLPRHSRYELKYVIDEHCAQAVRDFTRCHLVSDEHALNKPRLQYPIHSLYLDNANLDLCRATLSGLRNRFKLRIRFYDERSDTPVYFEIKRRLDDAICKDRAAVRRSALPKLLAGHLPAAADLVEPGSASTGALQQFCRLTRIVHAHGRATVSYLREAYVCPDGGSVRVTFDRGLTAQRYDGRFGPLDPRRSVGLDPGGVVLEIKFDDHFPAWLADMVRVFNLQRRPVAKYVMSAVELSRPGATPGHLPHLGCLELTA